MITFIFHDYIIPFNGIKCKPRKISLRGSKVWLISPCVKAGALRHGR